ncbi:MAG: FAD-binding oxidoreductase [Lewinellaceae bacterium]|nr:FAD-binding oxidoreductase [Lewinellaceae bacterium]
MKQAVSIIGCGVSGLTTAVVLQRQGWEATIYTDQAPEETVSAVAAAIWFPYEVHPQEKANVWSLASYLEFEELSKDPASGVSMVPLTVIVRDEADAWWTAGLPGHAIRQARPEEVPSAYSFAYRMTVPLIETQLYLPYLLREFRGAGGLLVNQKVDNIKNLTIKNLPVVNCTGMGAKELVGDSSLYPIRGQILKAEPIAGIEAMSADFTFGDAGEELAYIIPRRDCTVLGGTTGKGDYDLQPDEATNQGILARCSTLSPLVKDARIQATAVGLRPGRPEIRLEREGNLVHNYGHGGGGYTVSWGCAYEVANLLKGFPS